MTKVVDMQEKIQTRKQEEQLKKYRGRVETIQKILQCSSCHYQMRHVRPASQRR